MKTVRKRITSAFAVTAMTVGVIGGVASLARAAYDPTNPPYPVDPTNATSLTIYNASTGAVVTNGSDSTPLNSYYFVAKTDFNPGHSKATLSGFLAEAGKAPGAFAGEGLGGATTYPAALAPAPVNGFARPTAKGDPLFTFATFASDYPNAAPSTSDFYHLYQLRVRTTFPTPQSLSYAFADIQIDPGGHTWNQVNPAPAASTAPGAPTIGTATAGSTSATVTFTAPASNGGAAISGYTATATPGGATGSISGATAMPITVAGLTNGTAYTFTVHANNSAGSSPESAASNPVTPAAGTTTTLVASPVGQAYAGASVTITATVNSSAAGAVQFKDGTTNLGSAVTVTSGAASTSTSSLAAGTHSITAEFTPTDSAAFGSSTSAALSYKVIGVPSWKPTLIGSHRVAYTDSCIASFDNATSVTYVWLVNGSPVSGATGSSFKVPEAYWHQTLTCRVTATNPAGSQVGTSAGAVVGTGPALVTTVKPVLTGQHVHGQYEYCSHGTWNPAAVTYTYQWYVGTLAISRATSYRYAVPLSLKGKTINCVVKAHRSAAWTDGAFRTAAVRITA